MKPTSLCIDSASSAAITVAARRSGPVEPRQLPLNIEGRKNHSRISLHGSFKSFPRIGFLLRVVAGIAMAATFLGVPDSAQAQIALRHTVQAAGPASTIVHPLINDRSDRIVIVAHEFSGLGPYVTAPVNVSYSGGRWMVASGDGSNLPINAKMNILAAAPGENAFAHVASTANITNNYTTIDSPALNDKSNARVFVTESRSSTGNPHPVGVFYSGNRWRIFNQDLAAMPAGARFFVYVDDRGFVAEAPTAPIGNNFAADHISTNGKSDAMVFSTQYWTSVYNPHQTGVWYVAPKWRIYNEDRAAMPASAKFNMLALSEGDNTEYPPVTPRASIYDAASTGVEYPYEARLNPQTAITLEAWVYPDGRSTCGTIISNSFSGGAGSYWMGLCPQLRFYRSGGSSADATTLVPAFKWTHVAVTYDGTNARFYVNGEAAGTRALSNAGTGGNHPVMIGRDPGGFYFGGSLDEIRLWQGTRTQAQIQQGMWQEPRDDANLAAVFDTGGAYEVLGDLSGTPLPLKPKVSGTGILPRALRVPRAPSTSSLVVDGRIDPFLEYAGAERFVLRYPSSPQPDRTGYLIHNGTKLFGGITDLNTPLPAITPDQSYGAAYFDADGSGGTFASLDDLRISHTLGTIKRLDEGNDRGGWQAPRNNLGWEAAMGPRLDEFAAGSMEFSLVLNRLGATAAEALTQTDRFAFFHNGYDTAVDHIGAPGNAQHNSPANWAPMTYTNEISGPAAARAIFRGRVVDATTGASLANRRVRLFSPGGLEYASTLTNASGTFRFERAVPPIPLTVQVALNEGELTAAPVILENLPGPAPEFSGPTDARFPACETGLCEFDSIQFNIRTVIDATTVATIPASVTAPLTVRGGAVPKVHPAGEVILTGTNFHPSLEVYFTTQVTTPLSAPLAGLVEGTHYWRATVLSRTATTLSVSCPDVPLNRRPGIFQIVLRDLWNRPANSPPTSPWKLAPGSILVENPPYPLVHGFEFPNIGDGHDFDDYRAVFAGDVCNPLTMVGFWAYFPIYIDVLGGGECYGMTLTSQQFFKGRATAPFGADVFFANGYRQQLPASFNTDNFCAPSPTNLWGQIRVNHGTQMSAEMMAERVAPTVATIAEAIARLSSRPLDYHLCFRFNGMGHCVQPLRVINEVFVGGVRQEGLRQIEIYDCNHPQQIKLFNVDLVANTYTYDGFGDLWFGNDMNIYETEVLLNRGNHIPSLGSLAAAFLQLVVSGQAEPMMTSADGGQLGWNAMGDFVQSSTDTSYLPVANWIDSTAPPLGHYPVTMIHRLTGAPPKVVIHARGTGYKVHASNQGTMFQLLVGDAVDGQDDALDFPQNGTAVNGLSFAPSGGNRKVKALIALCQGGATFPAAISLANLSVPAGKSMVMRLLSGSTGIEFLNDTGLLQTPAIEVALPQAGAPLPRLVTPPAIELPPGCSFQMRSPDGVDYANLLAELDLDRNGTPERRWLFHTGTLILDELPIIPPAADIPVLTLTRTESTAQLRWQPIAGWVLTSSTDLSRWEVVPGVVMDGSTATHTISLPLPGNPTLLFRLEKR